MKHHAKIIGGSIYCLVALITASVSCTMNVQFGLTIGTGAAIVLFLAEVGNFTIPAVAALIGWDRVSRTVLVLCGAMTLFAAVSQWFDQDAKHLLSATTTNAASGRATEEYNRIVAALTKITVTGSAADLETLAKTYKKAADDEAAGGQGKRYRAALDKYTAIAADLAQARDKAKLDADLVSVKAELAKAAPVVASGLALVVSSVTGGDEGKIAMGLNVLKTGMTIALTQGLVYLGLVGFPLLISGIRGLKGLDEEVEEVASNVTVLKPLASRRDETLERLLSMCLRNPDGCIIASGRYLSEQLGVANSTLNNWLGRWEEEGKITVEDVTAHKKRFRAA